VAQTVWGSEGERSRIQGGWRRSTAQLSGLELPRWVAQAVWWASGRRSQNDWRRSTTQPRESAWAAVLGGPDHLAGEGSTTQPRESVGLPRWVAQTVWGSEGERSASSKGLEAVDYPTAGIGLGRSTTQPWESCRAAVQGGPDRLGTGGRAAGELKRLEALGCRLSNHRLPCCVARLGTGGLAGAWIDPSPPRRLAPPLRALELRSFILK
jgi:hypothetical protein